MPPQAGEQSGSDLALEGVVKAFGNVGAVDDVSLEVGHGQFYSLLGPSGCGKTTTLRLIAGFERPDAGRILLAGVDVSRVPPHRRNVNTVFQHYALFPHLSVEDNVAYGLRQRRLPRHELRSRLERALATVRLTELRARRPRELSGGQQQRVALARALVNEPTVLLLDEPLAALDLKLRRAMQGELKKLQERLGITFVYVTHDQEEALTLSDRIAVMNRGRILQEGTPDEIYERPANRFVADFIGHSNFFEGEVVEAGPVTLVRAEGAFAVRCAPAPWASAGMRVTVAVRPERVIPAPVEGWVPNRLTVTVGRRTYLGDLVRYHLLLPGGRELVCERHAGVAGTEAWEVGTQVDVTFEERNALVLAGEHDRLDQEEDLRLLAEDGHRSGG